MVWCYISAIDERKFCKQMEKSVAVKQFNLTKAIGWVGLGGLT